MSQPMGEPHSGPILYQSFGLDNLSRAVRDLLAERTHAPAREHPLRPQGAGM
ncbi:MAG TPA: hypothetical protein VIQ25_18845 [Gemmatimonadales bacterium]